MVNGTRDMSRRCGRIEQGDFVSMFRLALLACLVADALALLFLNPNVGAARDVGIISIIACIGIWIGWALPLEDS
jgi:hypothetical protein